MWTFFRQANRRGESLGGFLKPLSPWCHNFWNQYISRLNIFKVPLFLKFHNLGGLSLKLFFFLKFENRIWLSPFPLYFSQWEFERLRMKCLLQFTLKRVISGLSEKCHLWTFLRMVQWTVSEQLALEAPLPPLDLASACPATFCLWNGTDFRPTCLGAVVEGSARACESAGRRAAVRKAVMCVLVDLSL